jgi:peptidoglycan/xylan/chitin deacetylase (PgdA/CDA1 family)
MTAATVKRSIYLTTVAIGRIARVGRLRGLPDRPQTLRVLMYHKITSARPNSIAVDPASFEQQQAYLSEHYSVVRLSRVDGFFHMGEALPRRSVLLTFDDGYLDNLRTAYPVLKRYGHTAVLFLPTGFVGRHALPHDCHLLTHNPTANWAELANVLDVFEIGSHGISHRPLATLDLSAAREEVRRSKEEIEQRLGVGVSAFAYPKGSIRDFAPEHADLLRSAGYRLAFTTLPGVNHSRTSPFRIRRHNVEDYGAPYFEGLLDGSADLLALKDTHVGSYVKQIARRAMGTPPQKITELR